MNQNFKKGAYSAPNVEAMSVTSLLDVCEGSSVSTDPIPSWDEGNEDWF